MKNLFRQLLAVVMLGCAAVGAAAEIEDLGVGGQSAEVRSVTAFRGADGRRRIITRLQDRGPVGSLLVTDVESGESKQFTNPPEVRQGDSFGSILTSKELYLYDQTGGRLLAFDHRTGVTRSLGRPDPAVQHFMCYFEDRDGTVWMGGFPQATLTSYSPADGTFRRHGRMDPEEKYLFFIGGDDDGWLYCGIGTARANLVAFNPQTGERRDVLPEALRKPGQHAVTVITGADGNVYASCGKFIGKYRGGKLVEEVKTIPEARYDRAARSFSPNSRRYDFGDGSAVTAVNVDDRLISMREADGNERNFRFDFASGGLSLTSLGAGPDGKVYGSTSHPLRFIEVDVPGGGKVIDRGGLTTGGNLCAIDSDGERLYASEYAGGRMWEMDKTRPLLLTWKPVLFNGGPEALEKTAQAQGGKLRRLASPPVLYGIADGEDSKFTFKISNSETGKRYLNIQFYRHPDYGPVTVEFRGEKRRIELTGDDRPAPMLTFGPIEAAARDDAFTVVPEAGRTGKAMFGVMAASLDPAPRPDQALKLNPRIVARWPDLITRPRTILIHPDGRSIVMSGFANYGLTGGGFGIYDRITGKQREITGWLPGHSCIALAALPDGDLVGGTSIEAPGGGKVLAKAARLFRLSWPDGKLRDSVELPGVSNVIALAVYRGKIVAIDSGRRLLTADPADLSRFEVRALPAEWGDAPRKALLPTPDGRLFLLLERTIAELDSQTLEPRPVARCPENRTISAGGAVQDGALYFGCETRVGRWRYAPSVTEKVPGNLK